MVRSLTASAVVAVATLALGCAHERDPIKVMLAELEAAAEARDSEAIGRRLSAAFKGAEGLGRQEVIQEARRYFFMYESLDVELSSVEIQRDGDRARISFRADFSARTKKLPSLEGLVPEASAYRFELDAVAEDGGIWRLTSAHYEPVPLALEEEASPAPEAH